MSMKSQIKDAMKDAMRAKDKPRLGAIRLILSEVKRIEVDERIEIDDDWRNCRHPRLFTHSPD
jgi:uncharacterized protein YqeY